MELLPPLPRLAHVLPHLPGQIGGIPDQANSSHIHTECLLESGKGATKANKANSSIYSGRVGWVGSSTFTVCKSAVAQ